MGFVEQENTTYQKYIFPRLPKQIFISFNAHNAERNTIKYSYISVIKNEHLRKENILQKEVETTATRLFNFSNSSSQYSSLFYSDATKNLRNYLNHSQLELYNRCLEYINFNNYPIYYCYFVLDFLVSTKTKFLHLSEEEILNKIAMKFIINTRLVLDGTSSPKIGTTVYNTIPKAFSPLFFQKIQFVGTVLPKGKIREDFEECLVYGLNEQLRNAIYRIMQTTSQQEFNLVLNQILSSLQNIWLPKQLSTKFNQLKIYINNSIPSAPALLEFLTLNYLVYKSENFTTQTVLSDISYQKLICDLQKHIKKLIKAPNYLSKNGWSIFDSIPEKGSCFYKALCSLYDKLNKFDNINVHHSKILHLSTNHYITKAKLISGIHPNIFKIA